MHKTVRATIRIVLIRFVVASCQSNPAAILQARVIHRRKSVNLVGNFPNAFPILGILVAAESHNLLITSNWWLGRESNPRHEDFQSADFTLLLTPSD
jgi:hypothetical protein